MNWKDRATQVICEAMKGMKTTMVPGSKSPRPGVAKTPAIRHTEIDPDVLVKARAKKLGGDVKGATTRVNAFLNRIRRGELGTGRTVVQKGSKAFGRGVLGLGDNPPAIDPTKKVEPGRTGRPRGTPNR
jgi:hypothetical protein